MCDRQLLQCFDTLTQFREENELSHEYAFLFGLLVGSKVNRGNNFIFNALQEVFLLQTQEIEDGLTDQEIQKARVALFKKYNPVNFGLSNGSSSGLGKRTAIERQTLQLADNGSLEDDLVNNKAISVVPEANKRVKLDGSGAKEKDLMIQPTQLIFGGAPDIDLEMKAEEASTDAISTVADKQAAPVISKKEQEPESIQIDTTVQNFWKMDDVKESNLMAPKSQNSWSNQQASSDANSKQGQHSPNGADGVSQFFAQLQAQLDREDGLYVDPLKAAENEKLTLELIEQIQREEQEALDQLRKQQEEAQDNQFVCKICFDTYDEEHKIIPLMLCEHIFHQECLEQYLKTQIEDSKFPIKCPIPECNQEIGDHDLKDILPEELYSKFNEFTLNQAVQKQSDMCWCPTADCKYAYSLPEGQTQLNCPMCSTHYCLTCKVVYHEGKSCAQYQAENDNSKDDKFLQFVQGKKFKQCPKCQYWVERSMGCNHMTCRCGQSFCYQCGGIYGACECVRQQQEQQRQWRERQQEIRRERNRRAREARAKAAQEKRLRESQLKKKLKEQEKLKVLAKAKQQAKEKLLIAPTHGRNTRSATLTAVLKDDKKKSVSTTKRTKSIKKKR